MADNYKPEVLCGSWQVGEYSAFSGSELMSEFVLTALSLCVLCVKVSLRSGLVFIKHLRVTQKRVNLGARKFSSVRNKAFIKKLTSTQSEV